MAGLSWLQRTTIAGAALAIAWTVTARPGIDHRLVRDGVLFGALPLAFGLSQGRRLGWRVDRRALGNTVALSLFVLPFYVVGSTLPSIRGAYPIWETAARPAVFVPHAVKLLALAVATETYYRGLLCVGLGDRLGWKAALISPVVYAAHHLASPPIERLLAAPTDVLFGLVDYDADSILPSAVAHGAGLVLLDWLVLHEPLFDPAAVVELFDWLPIPL